MSMRPAEFKEFLKIQFTKNPKRPVFVTGGVGIGKSESIKQVCDELGFEMRDIRLSLLDAIDLRGLPATDKEKKETIWMRPTFLPPEDYETDLLLFFDEFSNANASLQNACLSLMLDRKIGEYSLPENTRIICAGNRLSDGAFVFKLSSAILNRVINIEFEPNYDDWKQWAYDHKTSPLIIGYHNYTNGRNLNNYKQENQGTAFASSRSWYFVDEVLKTGLEGNSLYEAIKGCIGEGAGTEFYGYMAIHKTLPDPKEILDGKNIVPKEINVLYALISALINEVKQNTDKVERLMDYSLNLDKEFSVLLVKDLMRAGLNKEIMKTKAWKKWSKEHEDVMF